MCGPRTSAQHHGEELTPLTDDSLLFDGPRTMYGRVRVLHQIGAGSMGPVFRGEDPASRPVVIKVLRVGLPPERVAIVATALAAARERLPSHPALCPMLDSGVHEAEPFVVSAFVDGDSLDVALREYGPANIVDALPRLRVLADALDSAAAVGVTHGGLHLRDIIVSPEHTVLTGIGIASILERVGVRPPVRRPYAAPEIAQGHGTSPAGDQFALAAVAHEWLSGRRIAGPGAEGFHLPATSAAGTEAVAAVFCRALDEAAGDRYPTATAFVDALAEVADALAPRARTQKRRAAPAAAPSLAFDFLEDGPGGPAPEATAAGAGDAPPALTLATPEDAALTIDTAPAGPVPSTGAATPPAPDISLDQPDEVSRLSIDLSLGEPLAATEGDAGGHPMADVLAARDVAADRDEVADLPLTAPAPVRLDADQPVPSALRSDAPPRSTAWPPRPDSGEDAEAALPSGPAAWAVVLVVASAIAIGGGMALVRWGTPAPSPAATAAVASPGTAAAAATAAPSEGPTSAPPAAAPAAAVAARPAAKTPSVPPAAPVRPSAATVPVRSAPPKSTPPAAPPGRLLVRSSPTGAEVHVNGQRRGVTPLAVRDLPLGGYVVRVARAGFTAAEQRVTLDAGRPSRALEVTLVREAAAAPAARPGSSTPGTLVVESRPPGARVVVDGRDAGRTPLTLPGVAPGPHAIRIELPGYLPITTTTRVEPGARARVAVSLTTERPQQR
ncbi:MAG: PEGA domain-containing protein [Vicinamibacterales bacterium]